MGNPYKPTDRAMEDLHSRSYKKSKRLFPKGPPYDVVKRINRELGVLESSPATYGLLIADEVIKEFRHHRFSACLGGDWIYSYHAWLMDLTEYNPIEHYQVVPLGQIMCNGYTPPIIVRIAPGWGKTACLELFRMRAEAWGFWLWECSEDSWKLISMDNRPDDIYAAQAPSIQITDSA